MNLIKTNKIKLIARVILMALLLVSVLNLTACGDVYPVLDTEIPNLKTNVLYFICMGNLSNDSRVDSVDYCNYSFEGGLNIVNGQINYDTPILNIDYRFDFKDLEKPSYSFLLLKTVDMQIWGEFFPFSGNMVNIKYDFKRIYSIHHIFNRVMLIYNDTQLIGKIYFDTYSYIDEEYVKRLFEENMILLSVKDYLSYNNSNLSNKNESDKLPYKKDEKITSCLSIGDIERSEFCTKVIEYSSKISGGLNTEFGSERYENITNTVSITFNGNEEVNFSDISIEAIFYECKEFKGDIRYEFENDNEQRIHIYNDTNIMGKITVRCNTDISKNWIEDFLNENIIIIDLTK